MSNGERKPMTYDDLAKVNVNDHIEKKDGLSYLSWAWAVDYMTRLDPDATWEYREWDNRPFLTLPDCSCMVYCTVTLWGKRRTAHLPVMDYKNKAIANPDAFQINTAMQRALVKAIALHGLGLYIYAGEDLPKEEADAKEKDPVKELAKAIVNANVTPSSGTREQLQPAQLQRVEKCANDVLDCFNGGYSADQALEMIDECAFDTDEKSALATFFDSRQRTALRKAREAKNLRETAPLQA